MVNMIRKKIFRLYNRFMQRNSNFLFKGILQTPPITANPSAETTLYCALDAASCREFILAAKSFLRYYQDIAVVVQSDGSLNEKCIAEIQTHIKGVIVYSKADMMDIIDEQASPRLLELIPDRGNYEINIPLKIMYLKFLNVICRLNGKKVVIIDSDLIFLRKPDFILQWLKDSYTRDFYSEGGNAKSEDFYAMGFKFKSLDIANFSSGTIGIGGYIRIKQLEDIFQRIQNYDPSLFDAWEIEQALWAIIMSERDNPVNIDELREVYVGSGWRTYDVLKKKAVIAHFAGAIRFKNFRYLRLGKDIIQELRA